ncbi:MAG: HD domain-containing phosphohydrolase [candidate division FCPU426 bacterium]
MTTQELHLQPQRARFDAHRRWWIISALIAVVLLINQNKSIAEFWPVLFILGLTVVYNFILTLRAYFSKISKIQPYLELGVDLILTGALVQYTGGIIASPLVFLLPLLIMVQAFQLKPHMTILSGAGALAVLVLLIHLAPAGTVWSPFTWERAAVVCGLTLLTTLGVRAFRRDQTELRSQLSEKENALEEARKSTSEMELRIHTSTRQLEKANIMLVKKNLALLAFHEIYTAMSSTYNSGRLLNLVMDTAMSLLKATAGALMLRESGSDVMKVRVSRGLDPKQLRGFEVKVGSGIEGEVAVSGKAELLTNLDASPRRKAIHPESRCKMCVPLRTKNRVVGTITVESSNPEAFSRNDLELFGTLGSQASEVLQNVEMYEELRRKADHLSLLFEVGKNIGSIKRLGELFETILKRTMQVMKARRGFLLIYDQDRDELVVRASFGLESQGHLAPLPVNRGITGHIYQKDQAVLISNVTQSPMYDPGTDEIYTGHILLAAPMCLSNKKFGIICLTDPARGHQFSNDNLNTLSSLASQAAIAIENVHLVSALRRDYLNSIKALAAAVDAKDHYTHGHSHKVMVYATAIAREMGLKEKEIEKIRYGALLHDIGKIGISEAVLNKPSKLTPREFDTIAMHPILGVSIVQNIESLKDLIPTILYHHERYAGGGYPEGKAGNSIPLGARIVAVADAWDVMTSDRAYRKALPISVAVAELKKFSGTQFDPELVEAFLRHLEKGEKSEPWKGDDSRSVLFWQDEDLDRLLT